MRHVSDLILHVRSRGYKSRDEWQCEGESKVVARRDLRPAGRLRLRLGHQPPCTALPHQRQELFSASQYWHRAVAPPGVHLGFIWQNMRQPPPLAGSQIMCRCGGSHWLSHRAIVSLNSLIFPDLPPIIHCPLRQPQGLLPLKCRLRPAAAAVPLAANRFGTYFS